MDDSSELDDLEAGYFGGYTSKPVDNDKNNRESVFAPLKTSKPRLKPKLSDKQTEAKKARKKKIRAQLKVKTLKTILKPIVSIDTEYEQVGDENIVVSCQFVVGFNGKYCQGILFPKSDKKSDRFRIETFLSTALGTAIDEGVLTEKPEHIIVVAHFLSADLFTFSNAFKDIKTEVNSVRKTVVSLRGAYGVDLSREYKKRIDDKTFKLYDKSRNDFPVMVTFYDSMLFAPAGFQSLAKIGELVNCPKLEIPFPYSIERMREYLKADKAGFTEYAIRDAMIACLHLEMVIQHECVEQGNSHLASTIGSLAVNDLKKTLLTGYISQNDVPEDIKISDKGFKQYFNSIFSKEQVTTELWKKDDSGTGYSVRTATSTVLNEVSHIYQLLAVECYHGGRNECYLTGPSAVANWYDLDVSSCYTVILNGLRPLDFDALVATRAIDDFMGDIFGLARVKFKFPDDTLYPSLPVKAGKFGLVYPLEGISYCVAAELEVARHQGAELDILQGIVVPWVNGDNRVFTPFMKEVREKRQHYKHVEKNVFLEKFWKEKGNSVYGRLAMGLRDKRVFDIQTGYTRPLEPGELTDPYLAAFVTGTARALLSALLIGIPKDNTVISLTTDGFISDATIDEIDQSLPVCQRFKEWFQMIDVNADEILEEKHRMQQVVAFKTRGQTTSIHDIDTSWKGVNARAGVQLPPSITGLKASVCYMNDFYLGREPLSVQEARSLTSLSDMTRFDKDKVSEIRDQKVSLEPDYKRDLRAVGMVGVLDSTHIQCTSVPHRTVEDMMLKRTCFDVWRETNCLKTMLDWDNWEDYFKLRVSLKNTSIRIQQGEDSAGLFKRMFLRVWGQELCAVERDMKQAQFVRWLNSLDDGAYKTNASAVSSAANPEKSKVIYGELLVTHRIVRLLKLLVKQYPKFEYERLFKHTDIAELHRLMASN